MLIKEYEAFSLKDCLQQVRNEMGSEAVILETRKFRKGGLLGWGAKDAVCIVAATGITVQDDLPQSNTGGNSRGRQQSLGDSAVVQSKSDKHDDSINAWLKAASEQKQQVIRSLPPPTSPISEHQKQPKTTSNTVASAAARNAYSRAGNKQSKFSPAAKNFVQPAEAIVNNGFTEDSNSSKKIFHNPSNTANSSSNQAASNGRSVQGSGSTLSGNQAATLERAIQAAVPSKNIDQERIAALERTMQEIRDTLTALHQNQITSEERTVSAVMSAVQPSLSGRHLLESEPALLSRFPDLYEKLVSSGVSADLTNELLESLPDFSAWSEEARPSLAESALRDVITRRMPTGGPIGLQAGTLKAVALIGPTGVGKTTTIAKLAAHYALVEGKRVALLTVDTYRIAAVEQLKIYSQIIDIPIGVAYSQTEVLAAVEQFKDYDLLLIDTAGRSHHNVMQLGELKSLLESVRCETHLVLSASTKDQDMLGAVQKFSAAGVDRLLFTKLDETNSYGTLLNTVDATGIPLSYFTTGQKVPEDIEPSDPSRFTDMLLGN